MAGRLTTHVLDIAIGCPAANMEVELWLLEPHGSRKLLKTLRTNVDGRTDTPVLAEDMAVGVYELVFAVGDYFAQQAVTRAASGFDNATPRFLERIPVQFGIADPTAHYHVPLLTSPWAYSTYRGS